MALAVLWTKLAGVSMPSSYWMIWSRNLIQSSSPPLPVPRMMPAGGGAEPAGRGVVPPGGGAEPAGGGGAEPAGEGGAEPLRSGNAAPTLIFMALPMRRRRPGGMSGYG